MYIKYQLFCGWIQDDLYNCHRGGSGFKDQGGSGQSVHIRKTSGLLPTFFSSLCQYSLLDLGWVSGAGFFYLLLQPWGFHIIMKYRFLPPQRLWCMQECQRVGVKNQSKIRRKCSPFLLLTDQHIQFYCGQCLQYKMLCIWCYCWIKIVALREIEAERFFELAFDAKIRHFQIDLIFFHATSPQKPWETAGNRNWHASLIYPGV